jgi:hypothetical protein
MKNIIGTAKVAAKKGGLYAGVLLLSDAIALGIDSVLLGKNLFHYFTLFTLVEAAILFLVGGAMEFGGSLSFRRVMDYVSKTESAWSIEGHQKAQSRALPLIVAGIILLVLSFALAYPLN